MGNHKLIEFSFHFFPLSPSLHALLSLVPGPTQAFQQFFIVHMLECWECPGDDALPYSLLPRGYCSYCIAFFLSPPSSFPILTHHIDDDIVRCSCCKDNTKLSSGINQCFFIWRRRSVDNLSSFSLWDDRVAKSEHFQQLKQCVSLSTLLRTRQDNLVTFFTHKHHQQERLCLQ